VWNLSVSTLDGVRVNAKFLKAVKYAGSVIGIWELLGTRRTTCHVGCRTIQRFDPAHPPIIAAL
jgi:hypothetical protein